jgi:hypothetical protein
MPGVSLDLEKDWEKGPRIRAEVQKRFISEAKTLALTLRVDQYQQHGPFVLFTVSMSAKCMCALNDRISILIDITVYEVILQMVSRSPEGQNNMSGLSTLGLLLFQLAESCL